MKPAGEHERHLTFHWPRPRLSLALLGFLLASLLLHAMAFYLFQVVYPPTVAISPPAASVNLITPSTPENQALLRWIDSEDPAAIAKPHEIVPNNLYDISYQRSFADVRTGPKQPDEKNAAVQFPPAVDMAELIGDTGKSAPRAVTIAPHETELKFSGTLAGRKIANVPTGKPGGPDIREPSNFLVGVAPDGKVQYVFFMGVEADDKAKALDAQAEKYLNRVEFARAGGDTAWGMATFYWGDSGAGEGVQP